MSKRPLSDASAPQQPQPKKLASIFAPPGSTPFKSRKMGSKQTCWHGAWGETKGSSKVLALDVSPRMSYSKMHTSSADFKLDAVVLQLDGTVVVPKSNKKFPEDEVDWKWWHASVAGKLKQMHKDG